jgi:ribose/xylose/arabinose/galactoside ABC-type transport system permease subunit
MGERPRDEPRLHRPRAVVLGLPVLSWAAILTVAVFGVVMTRTALGRAIYAVGGNPHAAVYAGIDVGRTQFAAFVMSGALAGLTGYLWVSRYAVAYVDIAGGFELEVVAACVIGGISIAGGIGHGGGAVLGALFLGVIKNALPVVGISPFWQMAISGSAILLAVAINAGPDGARAASSCGQITGQSMSEEASHERHLSGPPCPRPAERRAARLRSWESLLLAVAVAIFITNSFPRPIS